MSDLQPAAANQSRRLSRATVIAAVLAGVLTVVVSTIGLAAPQTYRVEADVLAALRGGDVLNLALGPAVLLATLVAHRGSARAALVLGGLLGYLVYCFSYYVFAPTFSDAFLAHVAVLVASGLGLVSVAADIDAQVVKRRSLRVRARIVAGVLLAVIAAMVWMEGSEALAFTITGEQPQDVLPYPEWRVHLGFALDLGMVAPAAATAAVLLWSRRAAGFVAGPMVTVALAVYQLNYVATQYSVAEAGTPGVTALDGKPLFTAGLFIALSLALLLPMQPLVTTGYDGADPRSKRAGDEEDASAERVPSGPRDRAV